MGQFLRDNSLIDEDTPYAYRGGPVTHEQIVEHAVSVMSQMIRSLPPGATVRLERHALPEDTIDHRTFTVHYTTPLDWSDK